MTISDIEKIKDIAKTIFNDKDLQVTLDDRKIYQLLSINIRKLVRKVVRIYTLKGYDIKKEV